MAPTLTAQHVMNVVAVVPEQVQVGDIVVYKDDRLMCHRVYGRVRVLGRTYFVHKGDNVNRGGVFAAEELAGRVEAIIGPAGPRTPQGRWSLAGGQRGFRFAGAYVVLVLLKRRLWGCRQNRVTAFVNRMFWKSCRARHEAGAPSDHTARKTTRTV